MSTVSMRYTAHSLAEIADWFESKATEANAQGARAQTKVQRGNLEHEATTWNEAAKILRNTTIDAPLETETK